MTALATAIRNNAARAIDELGLTADDVAGRLRALEIKGERMNENTCPLAVYLLRLDGVAGAEVNEEDAFLYPAGNATPVVVQLSDAAKDFLHWFDLGIYLDLVQNDTTAVAR
jgi:hypothetical protein